MQEVRGTALFEVSAAVVQRAVDQGSPTAPRRYPRRSTRIPPLEFWRNEHLVFARTPGFEAPSVSKIVYNCATRAPDLPERTVPSQGTPLLGDDTIESEFNLT